ncbi:AIPR family protein [uncultured Oscillibacter sp.]|uniref:AIPR family protein n=1 Tax=uncultured Oscillibacter sp. TaxID=876091 RepID=UPI0025CC6F0B|nr:AIPR family protein [uncultured Oscillibacter sp.]
MDVNEFRADMLEEVHLNATMNGTTPHEEFLALYVSALTDAEELEDFEQIAFEGIGSNRRNIQVDGYCFDELDNCLEIVISPFSDSVAIETLTATGANTWFRRAQAFVEESRSGFLLKNAEESSPGYGLAVDIKNRYAHVSRFKFFILTDMVMSSRISEIAGTEIDGIPVEYHIWDIARLQALQASKSGKEDVVIHLKDFWENGIPCLEAGRTSEYTAYLCNIPGKVLADLYNTYGGRLLEGNVRSFLTVKGKINKGIRNTILNEPSMFFAYNNGIAATASEVELEESQSGTSIVGITGLQIVNGGQTTVSLATALLDDKDRADDLRNIFVPMKLSVVTPEKAIGLIPNIAKYANAQNKVSDADFFSNHAFHIRMEEFSRRLIAPAVMGNQYGTVWYYERARGQYRQEQAHMTKAEKNRFLARNPKSQMFTKTDLAKYHELYRMLPHQVSTGAQKNFMKFANWATEEWEKHDTIFNEDFFKRIVALDILFKKTDTIVKNAPWYELGYKAQVVAYTLSMVLYVIQKEHSDMAFDFRGVWNRQNITHATELQMSEIAQKVYEYLTDPRREVQNVTEWAKREACWKGVKALPVALRDDFVAELVPVSALKEAEKMAREIQKQDNKVSAMVTVAEYGTENWKSLLKWGIENHVLTPVDISFVKTAIAMEQGKFPSEKQCIKIMQILEKARTESYPG